MFHRMRLCFALAGLLVLYPGGAGAVPSSDTSPGAPLQQRGSELRTAAAAEYKRLEKSGTLQRGSDVTGLVQKYIPAGTSFDDAKAVLRAAGCRIGMTIHGNVLGDVRLGGGIASGVSLVIELAPKAPGDFTVVDKVSASIIVQYS